MLDWRIDFKAMKSAKLKAAIRRARKHDDIRFAEIEATIAKIKEFLIPLAEGNFVCKCEGCGKEMRLEPQTDDGKLFCGILCFQEWARLQNSPQSVMDEKIET